MKFIKSVGHAINGILYTVRTEAHMRFHIIAVIFVSLFSYLYGISPEKYCILFLTFSLVMSLECVNTALERLCDFSCTEHNKYIKIVKDSAAGAVLISSVFAVFTAIFTFNDINRILTVILTVFQSPLYLFMFIVLAFLAIYFIFFAFKNTERNNKNGE